MEHITLKEIMVARVVNEDDKFMLLEVMKDQKDTFTLKEADQFLTFIFVRQGGDGSGGLEVWVPWNDGQGS